MSIKTKMRLFRSKEKKSSASDTEDAQSSRSLSDNSPQRSIFRSMGLIFSRSQNKDNEGSFYKLGSMSDEQAQCDEENVTKGGRRHWFSRFSDTNSLKCESVTPSPNLSVHSCDDGYTFDGSNSFVSLSLSPLSIKSIDDSAIPLRQPMAIPALRLRGGKHQMDKQNFVDYDSIYYDQTDSNSFEIRHATSLNTDGRSGFDHDLWFCDDDSSNAKDQKQVVKERGFFNLRNKLSSLNRNLTTPKAFKFRSSKNKQATKGGSSLLNESASEAENLDFKGIGDLRIDMGNKSIIDGDMLSSQYYKSRSISTISLSGRDYRVVCLSNTQIPEMLSIEDNSSEVQKIEEVFSSLPLLKETALANRPELFQEKLIACQTIVDFDARKQMQKPIELKRQILLEIIEYISTTRNCINERVLQDVIDMVAANVFRPLPHSIKKINMFYDYEDDEPALEKSWAHLQIVYDVFLRVIVSNEINAKMAKNVIDRPFVLKLLSTLNSEDQRERDYLKTILHRIYGKIVPLRNFIRKAIDNVFTHFVYDTEIHYGITELLEILGSIINGFAIPLKEEHKIYLKKALAPLHKPKSLRIYHPALTYCMIQYINKDRTLSATIINFILKYWPNSSAQKEILFLNELEGVLSLTELPEFNIVLNPLIKRLALCLSSTHFQVAERTLYIWNNERIVRLFNLNKEAIYPHIVPVLHINANSHWNSAVRSLMFNVSKILSDQDLELYEKSLQNNVKRIPDEHIVRWNYLQVSYQNKHNIDRRYSRG